MRGIGVEITENLIRVAVVDHRGKSCSILGFYEHPVGEGESPWPERALAALTELRKQARLPRAPVVASIDSAEAQIRTLPMPFKDVDQIAKTVKFQLEEHLPQHAAEDLIVDFHKVAEGEKNSTVLCAAVPKGSIADRLDVLKAAGLEPAAIDLDLHAVALALRQSGAMPDEGSTLVVHGTDRFAKLMLYQDGVVRLLRSIRFSIPELTAEQREEVVRKKQWDTKSVIGPVPLIILAAPQAAAIEDLAAPTQTTLMNHLAKSIQQFLLAAGAETPDQILLTGEFDSAHVVRMLSKRIKANVRSADVLGAFDHPFDSPAAVKEIQKKIATALGLALRAARPEDRSGPRMDFRQEEFAAAGGLGPHAGTLLVTLQLLLVLVAAFGLKFHLTAVHHEQLTIRVRTRQAEVAAAYLGDRYRPEADAVDQVRVEIDAVTGGAAGSPPPVERSAYEVLGELYLALNQFGATAGLQMDLEQIQVDLENGRLQIDGFVNDPLLLPGLRSQLTARPLVESVGEAQIRPPDGSNPLSHFQITVTLKVRKAR